ncbi:tRNA (adenosine(37)-N6)-dimethylallyltransferase MiaA [Candidatus Falkowbacteria bacterium]|nr:tRNA (adenosine(37)-N6)-dimethylallyltransferase MiaA [Candidatus Falkowbacteria bacterium]
MKKKKIVIVLGPTASGKSSVALALAKRFGGFLISADSRQVYKGMDIGTNKDKGEWRQKKFYVEGVEECLIDVVSPNDEFTVGDWLEHVEKTIFERPNKLPIIVGGTGLYISALVNNFKLPVGRDEKLRLKFERLLAKEGIQSVIDEIKKIDPDIEQKIDSKNPRRVIRAAEICFSTSLPFERAKGKCDYEILQISVQLAREKLYEKINQRVDEMAAAGLIQEVKRLLDAGCRRDSTAMTGIGYRQICRFLNHEISGTTAIESVKRDTRQYAKRQMTWFKRDKTIHWVENKSEALRLVKNFLHVMVRESFDELRINSHHDRS